MLQDFLKIRSDLLTSMREFFAARNVLEVITPTMAISTNPDPHIESFVVENRNAAPFYLQTSPEFAMKDLLSKGSGDIYQFCPAYRRGEEGGMHSVEFTMLEWYRLDFDHKQLMDEVAEFLYKVLWQGKKEKHEARVFSYSELCQKYLNLDPAQVSSSELKVLSEKLNCAPETVTDNDLANKDFWLNLLFSSVVEPKIENDADLRDRPIFIHYFPASQAALARLNPKNPEVAERFEVYVNGVELGNGFHELADAKEQRTRFEHELATRAKQNQDVPPMPEDFLSALERGLPDCSGVAIGFDRLLMLVMGKDSLPEL